MDPASAPRFEQPSNDAQVDLVSRTVGLVTKAEFTRRREELEQQQQDAVAAAAAAVSGGAGGSNSAAAAPAGASVDARAKKKKKRANVGGTLSFGDDLDAEDEEAADVVAQVPKKSKLGKNPAVNTSMLYDADREAQLATRREELAKEWQAEQAKIKAERLEVTYSYHDPSGRDGFKGHRHTVEISKGFTIAMFLDKCREQVTAIRGCGSDQLIYVKEDIILPHSLTFYELIVNKARGKSGPLFSFDVHDDVRVGSFDHRIEKDESHPGKVMQRHVYDRLRDTFPYSRFEVYDPAKKWDTYTVHGHETFGEGNDTAMGAFGVVRK